MFADVINALILIGAIQAMVLALALFFWKRNRFANKILGIFLLLISLETLVFYFNERIGLLSPFARQLIRSIQFVLPGIFYMYTSRILGIKTSKTTLWLFAPAVVYVIVLVGVSKTDIIFFTYLTELLGVFGRELVIAILVMTCFYLFKKSSHEHQKSLQGKTDVSWLSTLFHFYIFNSLLSVFFATILRFPLFRLDENPFVIVHVLNALFMYWVSYKTITQPIIFHDTDTKHQLFNPQYEKYQGNTIPKALAESIMDRVRDAMENSKVFLNPNLKLDDLAASLKINRNQLSQVINDELGQSFNSLINSYRIDHAKSQLTDKEFDHLTISAIAFEAGFNSLATFNRVFKDRTGSTPNEFKQNRLPKL
jgi:AraC-like DNA-binding protein